MAIAIVTCMDNRLRTTGSMGLDRGEAHVIRTAGGRVTDDVLRSLTAACSLLDVRRIAVVHHTDCRALAIDDREIRVLLTEQLGTDPGNIAFLGDRDLPGSVRTDVAAVRGCRSLPRSVVVEGYLYDTPTHVLTPVTGPPPSAGSGGAGGANEMRAGTDPAGRRRPQDLAGFRTPDGIPW